MNAPLTSPWSDSGVTDAALTAAVNAPVGRAVDEIRTAFPDIGVVAWPDGQGGARVVLETMELGPAWVQSTSWLAFDISYVYPDADCYPHYIRPDLQRVDNRPIAEPFHLGNQFAEQPATMVSRRSNGRVPSLDTAARKAQSVINFIQEQS